MTSRQSDPPPLPRLLFLIQVLQDRLDNEVVDRLIQFAQLHEPFDGLQHFLGLRDVATGSCNDTRSTLSRAHGWCAGVATGG